MKKLIAISALAAASLLALSGCSGGDPLASAGAGTGSSGDQVIIGSADFTESQLIASIYSEALQAAGVDVKEQFNIGSREVYMAALQDGSIDLIPEYSGALLKYLDTSSTASTTDDVLAELATQLPTGTSLLDHSLAEDKDVLAVTSDTAAKYDLEKISDLAPVAAELSLGGPPEWKTRVNGVIGLVDVYGINFREFVSLDAGGPLTMTALTSGQIQVGDIFSTDPGVTDNDLVVLEDDKSLFAAENVVPVITTAKLDSTIAETLNAVSAQLTTKDLIRMNSEASSGTNLAEIAIAWLTDADLI
ncbi:ABC transporter substrate-binding protein [Cryobacterium sp. Y62]|uniref:ABC transporter substrate-binding protein n=1 Tax=Cryobacterium sp. Y62 TaxID=2048284 RepID=UPI000CE3954E|nr:ABC transporter substrate-binding protein [Cryobacterium sp. Y62]